MSITSFFIVFKASSQHKLKLKMTELPVAFAVREIYVCSLLATVAMLIGSGFRLTYAAEFAGEVPLKTCRVKMAKVLEGYYSLFYELPSL